MINFSDGELLDLLPAQMKGDTDMICLSHALRIVAQTVLDKAAETQTQCFIDHLPEHIVDVMAVELNAMYYDQSLSLATKRAIVKASFSAWYAKAGTPAAVEELVQSVFGEGYVVEWYDFEGAERIPGTFDIITTEPLTEDILVYFSRLVNRVKNERSHLRRVLVIRKKGAMPRVGVGAVTCPKSQRIIIRQEGERNGDI